MSHASSSPAPAPNAGPDGASSTALGQDPMLYRQAFDSAAEALFIADGTTGRVVAANSALGKLISESESRLAGQPLNQLRLFREQPDVAAALLGVTPGTCRAGDRLRIATSDGTLRSFELTATGFDNSDRPMVCCSLRDVTAIDVHDRRRQQARKMEAVRLLASSTAHDFNNVLSCIRGYVSIALETAGVVGEIRDILNRVKDVSLRAGELPQRLLDFSRQRKLTLHPLELGGLVRRAGTELQPTLPAGIAFHVRSSEAPVPVRGDETTLRLALTLLLRNAREAIGEQGEIVLEAARWEIPAPAHAAGQPAEVYARLSLRDSGCGMSPETLERLFEPGFTTKKTGRASGMSLSTVYRIAVQHGGWVEVDSATGQGSTVALILPLDTSAQSAAA